MLHPLVMPAVLAAMLAREGRIRSLENVRRRPDQVLEPAGRHVLFLEEGGETSDRDSVLRESAEQRQGRVLRRSLRDLCTNRHLFHRTFSFQKIGANAPVTRSSTARAPGMATSGPANRSASR